MRGRGRTTARLGGAIAISLCLHVLFSRWTQASSRDPHLPDLPASIDLSIVDVTSDAMQRAPEPEPPPNATPEATRLPAASARPRVKRPERERSEVAPRAERDLPRVLAAEAQQSQAELVPAQSLAVAETNLPAEHPEESPARPSIAPNLSPSAVAMSWEGKCVSSIAHEQKQPTARPERTATDAQAQLNDHLYTVANDIAYARRRDPPKLARRGDGNLWYEGRDFFAVITPDGTVKFSDITFAEPLPPKMRQYPPGLAPEYIELIKRIRALLTIRLPFPDLTDMVARVSDDDPYASEKRWLLRETEDVRRQLADEYRVEETRKAETRVIGELRGIVANPKLSADDKRIAVFAVWDMCAGDGDEKWQQVVESFIRDRMPNDSELGYSPELLARLNRTRASVRNFAPYDPR
jgi:hypothetical protein